MRLILDTHVLIWALLSPERIPLRWRDLIKARDIEILFSAVSIWEIAIKAALRRSDFPIDARRMTELARATEFIELPVRSSAAARVAHLPAHHRDPFDRLLVAQAIDEDARLLTADAALGLYAPHILTLA